MLLAECIEELEVLIDRAIDVWDRNPGKVEFMCAVMNDMRKVREDKNV